MLVTGVSSVTLQAIALQVGVRANIRRAWTSYAGTSREMLHCRFGLRLGEKHGTGKAAHHRYQRVSSWRRSTDGGLRRMASVCWHGHREFFRALFKACPGARVQSVQTVTTVPGKWYTADNFETVYQSTGGGNVGSQYAPLAYADACACQDAEDGREPDPIPAGKYVHAGAYR